MATQINLPRDAEGRDIPLDTKVLYDGDGNAKEVQAFDYSPVESMWRVLLLGDFILFLTYDMHLTPPDSWEKLLDDMERAIHAPDPDTYVSITCGYFDSANMDCAECERKHDICRETCNDAAWLDIAARIDKLRREDQ